MEERERERERERLREDGEKRDRGEWLRREHSGEPQ
jgi:hypothetical protein